ncbi:MAG: hydrogenase [Deltaproteobacteria bacterium]|nr:hydrogenase [Deltaproteobacteria bacterium]
MDWLVTAVILISFIILAEANLWRLIRLAAIQGALLSILPPIAQNGDLHSLLVFAGSFTIKAVVIPLFLYRSIKEAKIQREGDAAIGVGLSLLCGGGILVTAFAGFRAFPLPTAPFPPLIIPAALATVLIGFFLLVSRTQAITQVIGFLVLENGVFLFGITLLKDFPLTVELGVLLDLLVGVFVMGIMIYHINRTFDHIDTAALTKLRDH